MFLIINIFFSAVLDCVEWLNCDLQPYQTVFEEEEPLMAKIFVTNTEKETAMLNNNTKLMTLLFQTLGVKKCLSNICEVTELR